MQSAVLGVFWWPSLWQTHHHLQRRCNQEAKEGIKEQWFSLSPQSLPPTMFNCFATKIVLAFAFVFTWRCINLPALYLTKWMKEQKEKCLSSKREIEMLTGGGRQSLLMVDDPMRIMLMRRSTFFAFPFYLPACCPHLKCTAGTHSHITLLIALQLHLFSVSVISVWPMSVSSIKSAAAAAAAAAATVTTFDIWLIIKSVIGRSAGISTWFELISKKAKKKKSNLTGQWQFSAHSSRVNAPGPFQ